MWGGPRPAWRSCNGLSPRKSPAPSGAVTVPSDSMKQPQKQKCFPAQREKPKTRCNRHNRQTFFPCNAPALRLDLESARQLLSNTVQSLRPTLLILDPLIRLHRLDENDASQVAGLLSFLRHLQREFQLAVLLVHHACKGSNSSRPGQAE